MIAPPDWKPPEGYYGSWYDLPWYMGGGNTDAGGWSGDATTSGGGSINIGGRGTGGSTVSNAANTGSGETGSKPFDWASLIPGAVQTGVGYAAGALPGGPTNTGGTSNTLSTQNQVGSSNNSANFNQQLLSLLQTLSHTEGSGTNTSTTTPNLSPQTQALINSLTAKYQNLTTPSLTGYEAQQTQGFNRNADLQQQAAQQMMASRGLSTSPVAGTTAVSIDAQRFGNITRMQEGLPLLRDQLDVSHLGAAAQFMNMIPHGTTTTGASTNVADTTGLQTQNQTSGGTSNNWGNTANSLVGTSGTNSTSTSQKLGSTSAGLAGAAGGIANLLASLYAGQQSNSAGSRGGSTTFSDKRLKKDIKPIDKAVDKIMSLRPVSWKWKGGEVEDSGLLAQDLLHKLPELVDKTDSSGFLKVNYAGLIGTLVGAIQELATESN